MELEDHGPAARADDHQSRWLMAPFIGLATWIGLAYIFGDPVRTSTPSFGVARDLMPLASWGLLFLAGGIAMGIATLMNITRWMTFTLFIGGVIYSWWAGLFVATALHDPSASLVIFVAYFFIAFVHFAAAWRSHLRTI